MIGHPLKMGELFDEITQGDFLLPENQCSYVWKGPQVAKLIDSIYREYPVGQILLWDIVNLPVTKTLKGVNAPDLPTAGSPKIVLVEQQRLTCLYLALSSADDERNVFFNRENETRRFYLSSLDAYPRWIRVREVATRKIGEFDILKRLESRGIIKMGDALPEKYFHRIQKIKNLRNAKCPIKKNDIRDV